MYIVRANRRVIDLLSHAADEGASWSTARDFPIPVKPRAALVLLPDGSDGGDLVAVGRFMRHGRQRTDLDVPVRLDPALLAERPIDVRRVVDRLPPGLQSALAWRIAQGGDLPAATADLVRDVLRDLAPELLADFEHIERLMDGEPASGPSAMRWSMENDAISTVLRIGDFPNADLGTWEPPEADQPLLRGLLGSQEAGMIDYDASRFPGLQALPQSHTSVRVFTDGDRRLEVTNANANGVETALGTDLLYYNHHNRGFVLVQYKKTNKRGFLRVDERMLRQVERMDRFTATAPSAKRPRDYRVGTTAAAWLKVVDAAPFDPRSSRLLPGMYIPTPYLSLLLDDDCTSDGTRRALSQDRVRRYVTNTLFIELVREGWVGTTSISRAEVERYVRRALREERSVVVAEEFGEPDDFERRRPRRRRVR